MLSNVDADAEIQSTYILRSTVVLLFDLQSSIPTTYSTLSTEYFGLFCRILQLRRGSSPPTHTGDSQPSTLFPSVRTEPFVREYSVHNPWFWFCFYSQWKSFDSFILLHTEYSRHVSVQTPIESVLSDCPDFAIAATSHARHGVLGSWCRFHSVLAATILLQTAGLSTLLRKG